jgi:hypothetical protein
MKKVHSFQGETAEEALQVPESDTEDLAHYIALANLVPPEPHLPRLDTGAGVRYVGELRDVDMSSLDISERRTNESFEKMMSRLQNFPQQVRDYFESFAADVGKSNSIYHYEEIQYAQERLRIVMTINRELEISKKTGTLPPFRPFALPLEMYLYIDEDGKLQVVWDSFAYAVKGKEASRIRQCAICNKFFWAYREDQKCCGKKCSGVYRVRRLRKRYAEDPVGYIQRRAARERAAKKHCQGSNTVKGK